MWRIARCIALTVAINAIAFAQTVEQNALLSRGISAYRSMHYQDAIESFTRLTEVAPRDATAFLYLGTACATKFIPLVNSLQNTEYASAAEAPFRKALELAPDNKLALASLGLLLELQSVGHRLAGEPATRDARRYLDRLASVDPQSGFAVYTLGAVSALPALLPISRARDQLRIRPEDQSPLRDVKLRQDLGARTGGSLDEAVKYFTRAVEIDPNGLDTLEYLKLCWRLTSDLANTPAESARALGKSAEFERKFAAARKAIDEGRARPKAEPSWGIEIESTLLLVLQPPPYPIPPPPLPKL